jgi:hypothetical protein
VRKRDRVVVWDAQEVVGEALRAFRADARQLVELLDELRNRRRRRTKVFVHRPVATAKPRTITPMLPDGARW